MNLDEPIAVVGAGMSGIFAAEKLRSLGYRRIEIFESQAQLGGLGQSIEIDGKFYDFQAHYVLLPKDGSQLEETPIKKLLDKYPMEVRAEHLHFVSRSRAGRPQRGVPPNFIPLIRSLTPEQVVEQLLQTWRITEDALKLKTGPGLNGLAFDKRQGETWESYRARHPPLVGEILQSIMLYANMRRPGQPAETVINANAYGHWHAAQTARGIIAAYPRHSASMLARMPASMIAQIDDRLSRVRSFVTGYNSFLRRIVHDCDLQVMLDSQVVGVEALRPGSIKVSFLRGAGPHRERLSRTYARLVVCAPPQQTREMFADEDIRELFSERSCPPCWTRSYLVKVDGEILPFPKPADGGEAIGFWLIDPYSNYTDSDVGRSLHCITAANRQHESPYWLCFSNSDKSISDEEAWRIAKDSNFLFKGMELITERISRWPVYPSAVAVKDGWFDKVEALQGRHGIYFASEVLTGPLCEPISDYVAQVIPRWFGDAGR